MNPFIPVRGALTLGFAIGSRTHFVLSGPMPPCMGSATHGVPL